MPEDTPLFDQLVAEQDHGLLRRVGVGIYLENGISQLEAFAHHPMYRGWARQIVRAES